MRGCRLHTGIGFILGAMLLCFSTSAQAGWVLYDDFSDADWSDKWEFGPTGANVDLSWTQTGGVLRLVKTKGTTDISKGNGNVCRFIPRNFPSDANGIKYDIRVTAATGVNDTDTFLCTSRVRMDGYPFIFDYNIGHEAMERYTDVGIEAYSLLNGLTINFQQHSRCEAKANEERNILMHESRGWMETDKPLGIWTKVTIQQGTWAGFIDLQMANPTQQRQYSRIKLPFGGSVVPDPYFILMRVLFAHAGVTFTIEIDNVYYHTGELQPEIEGTPTTKIQTVVVPM